VRSLERLLPPLTLLLLVLLGLCLLLAPAEMHLGHLIKLVYVHGALVWVGLMAFAAAAVLGLLALLVRRTACYHGTQAAGQAALFIWILVVLSSMAVTGLTWGQVIAWGEPRVRAMAFTLGAALVLSLVTRVVSNGGFTAFVNLLMGIAAWVVVRQVDVIRHPVNPIGASGSASIQLYYLLVVVALAGLALTLVAHLWSRAAGRGELT
jgi:hypothetical protein